MALTKQISLTSGRVSVDFPVLPRVPRMRIPEDHAEMQAFQVQMDSWYAALRQVHLDKLTALQTQIDAIKKG